MVRCDVGNITYGFVPDFVGAERSSSQGSSYIRHSETPPIPMARASLNQLDSTPLSLDRDRMLKRTIEYRGAEHVA
jgi:hypothetical protein